jgi:predicted small metal-binding protein
MMKLSCKDMDSASTCNFEATGSTATEVAGKMLTHAKAEHPESVMGKSDEEMMSMMESKVHE